MRPQDNIPELNKLSNQELEDLLNDDEKFERFLQKMDRLRNTETIVKELREENERVASNPHSSFVISFASKKAQLFDVNPPSIHFQKGSTLAKEPELRRMQEDHEAQLAILKVHQSELEANAAKLSEIMKVSFFFFLSFSIPV